MVKEGVLAEGPRMEGGWTDASPRNGGSKVSKDEQDASQASPRPDGGGDQAGSSGPFRPAGLFVKLDQNIL